MNNIDIINDLENKLLNIIKNFSNNINYIDINKIPINLFYNIKIKDNNKIIDIKNITNILLKNSNELIIEIIKKNNKYIKIINNEILNFNLDFNINIKNNSIIVKLPLNTKERRNKILKYIEKILEKEKIIIRNIRNIFNKKNMNIFKNKTISKNDYDLNNIKINKIINKNIELLKNIVKNKNIEINKI